MAFHDPVSLDDSTFLGRFVDRLVERFVMPFADAFASSALAILAVPFGCVSVVVAMAGAGILSFFLPGELTGRIIAGGAVVGLVAAILILLQARSRFRRSVRRGVTVRLVRPIDALARDPWLRELPERARTHIAERRAQLQARLVARARGHRGARTA